MNQNFELWFVFTYGNDGNNGLDQIITTFNYFALDYVFIARHWTNKYNYRCVSDFVFQISNKTLVFRNRKTETKYIFSNLITESPFLTKFLCSQTTTINFKTSELQLETLWLQFTKIPIPKCLFLICCSFLFENIENNVWNSKLNHLLH